MTTKNAATIYDHLFRSFGLKENPFHVSPDPRFLFSGPAYQTALAELMFGIESRRGFLMLTGEAGTGKTTLIRHFLQWLNDHQISSSYVFHTHLDPAELFEVILRDFDVPVASTKKTDLLATLHRWLQVRQAEGDSPVVVIDEAQALSVRTLSELLQLLNLENPRGKLLQIILAGQPELEEKLRRPELRAIRQRVMVRCRLTLLTLEETGEYIATRLRGAGGSGDETFPPETVQTLYSYARGIPRVVNLLCEHALIGAFADGHIVVSPTNVRRAAAEFDLPGDSYPVSSFDLPLSPVASIAQSEAPTPAQTSAGALELEPPGEVLRLESQAAAKPVENSIAEQTLYEPIAAPPALAVPLVAEPAETFAMPTASQAAVQQSDLAALGELPKRFPLPPMEFAHSKVVVISDESRRLKVSGWRKYRPESAFRLYCRDVGESFVRDMRHFARSFTPQVIAFAGSVPLHAESVRRKIFDPLRSWLRTPIARSRREENERPESRTANS